MALTRPRWTAAASLAACLLPLLPALAAGAEAAAPAGTHAVCAVPSSSHVARCLAVVRDGTEPARALAAGAAPPGYGPADLRDAYDLPASGGDGRTIAVVDAYDTENAEADLAVYRSEYGLPPCTSADGCFRKVGQDGDPAQLPAPDSGWAVETSLDLDMASAACPDCALLLVEADDASLDNLGTSVDTAVALGASVVSNSYGAAEYTGFTSEAAHYTHPGVPVVAASGDSGFQPAAFPAVYSSVIAVGGTSLTRAANTRGWSESVWAGSGSGCSAWIPKPRWQHDTNCGMRTTADLAAVSDPQTGLAVYVTSGQYGQGGWKVVGGTSAAAPFVAGVLALAGHTDRYDDASPLYAHPESFFDVTSGSNGYCGGDYLCTGLPGYDAPTGLGTPDGLSGL
jgi:subtilase family serine protease